MVRGGPANRAVKRAKVFALAKSFGAKGRSKNVYSLAVRMVQKSLQRQYIARRTTKREMRSLWITRINIASREHHVPYSVFMNQLTKNNIQLNRKMLSELAIHEPRTFKAFADFARERQKDGLRAAFR